MQVTLECTSTHAHAIGALALLWYKYKNNIKLDEVGMAGSKSTQTRFVRDNRIYYTSLCLLFSIMHLLMLDWVRMWETFKLFPRCHDGSGWSVLIQSHYYWLFLHPSKASVGMYSRCKCPLQILFVYFLILPSLLHPSILYCFCLFLNLFLFFFYCN